MKMVGPPRATGKTMFILPARWDDDTRDLTYRRDVSVVVSLVAVAVHDARLADVRVAQHQDLVRGCEIQRHVCLCARVLTNCCWVDNRVVGRGLFSSRTRSLGGVEDRFEACASALASRAPGVKGFLTPLWTHSSIMRGRFRGGRDLVRLARVCRRDPPYNRMYLGVKYKTYEARVRV